MRTAGHLRCWFGLGLHSHYYMGWWLALGVVLTPLTALAAPPTYEVHFTVQTGKRARQYTPVWAEVELPAPLSKVPPEALSVQLVEAVSGQTVPAQITPAPEAQRKAVRVWWILPACPAGEERRYRAVFQRRSREEKAPAPHFHWRDNPGQYLDLLWDDRPVLRYMYAYDPQRREETYKTYHHLFDPAGKRLLTKGPGGLYPHHRGLFIGWNRLRYDGKTGDWWHMKPNGTCQRHERFLRQEAGPVFARLRCLIHWNDPQGQPVLEEEREVTVFRQPAPTMLVEFVSQLHSQRGEVRLEGDKNHGGFQFRAANEVSQRQGETRYLFPPGWPGPDKTVGLPWAAMSFALGDSRFTVAHFNHPANPRPTDYSADRKYGRFGAFFKYTLPPDQTLTLRYRLFVQEGEVPPAEVLEGRYRDFVDPPPVVVQP